jgi:hypothetical protein
LLPGIRYDVKCPRFGRNRPNQLRRKKWNLLNEYISIIVKKRSQFKQAIVKMVQECCTYVDQTPGKEIKIKFIEALRTVPEGKIYVEIERASQRSWLISGKPMGSHLRPGQDTNHLEVDQYEVFQ